MPIGFGQHEVFLNSTVKVQKFLRLQLHYGNISGSTWIIKLLQCASGNISFCFVMNDQVRELMGQFTPLTPLALVLKQFLADRSLDHAYKGGLSSYCQVTCYIYIYQDVGSDLLGQNWKLNNGFLPFNNCCRLLGRK